ncbi:hypothetical protein AJ88_33220 [Mesorhizobium amorphae CCBAU 01583]|nr:hypothetical protein AJ88_33220 [Mesorhizobium amorphae CCBAU 01583]
MGSAEIRVDRPISEQTGEWRQDCERHPLNRGWRLREDDHVGKFPGDDRRLKQEGFSFLVHPTGIGEAEEHADQQLEAVRVNMVRALRPFDFDQDVCLVGPAAVPPIVTTPASTVADWPGPRENVFPAMEASSRPLRTVNRSIMFGWKCSPTTAAPGRAVK